MKNELPVELVPVALTDMDFLRVELDINHCRMQVKWLRQVSSDECLRGLKFALHVALELKAELKKTSELVQQQ